MIQNNEFTRKFVIDFLKLEHSDRSYITLRAGLWDEQLRTLNDYDFTYYVMRKAIKERKISQLKRAVKFYYAEKLMSF